MKPFRSSSLAHRRDLDSRGNLCVFTVRINKVRCHGCKQVPLRRVLVQAKADGSQLEQRINIKPRFIQHKNEAKAFYAFLSQVYDYIVNPGHWTVDMRDDALLPADLHTGDLKVVDVGGGTGFCTQGIVRHVAPENVTLLDQSPHQLAKAKNKKDLKGVTMVEGDAEALPFEEDMFDRYVSAGSIEYWPDPQRGICEAYRVLKPGGKACLIGPVHPTFWLSRWMADVWMLFPTEDEYIKWFKAAGFDEVRIDRIGPKWYRGVRRHGLIMGCSVSGVKKSSGISPIAGQLPSTPSESSIKMNTNLVSFLTRLLLGTLAGFYYFVLPIYMWLKNLVWPKQGPLAKFF